MIYRTKMFLFVIQELQIMSVPSEWETCWQDWYRYLSERKDETFESAVSGTKYTGEQLADRLDEEVELMKGGEYPANPSRGTRPAPRVKDSEGNYVLRDVIDQEWYDLTTEKKGYHTRGSTTFTNYSTSKGGPKPHQGWKVRVAAQPREAREVAKTVLPYLQEKDLRHKVVQDVNRLNNLLETGQEGKFITIYPSIDEDRQNVIMKDGKQQFKKSDPSWNAFSINSNTQNTRQIIDDLEEELNGSVAGLKGARIDGHNGEEKQYGDTRIHFRYAHHFNIPAEIVGREGETQYVGKKEGLVNQEGELIEGSYIGDQIDVATRPDSL